MRIQYNKEMNELARPASGFVLVKCDKKVANASNQPQDMWLWPGLEVIGHTHKSSALVKNGIPYIVTGVSDTEIALEMTEKFDVRQARQE